MLKISTIFGDFEKCCYFIGVQVAFMNETPIKIQHFSKF